MTIDNEEERKRIGLKIAEIRNKRGLSIRKLSELSGVPFVNIGLLEKGRYNASFDILSKIANALGGCYIDIIDKNDIDKNENDDLLGMIGSLLCK